MGGEWKESFEEAEGFLFRFVGVLFPFLVRKFFTVDSRKEDDLLFLGVKTSATMLFLANALLEEDCLFLGVVLATALPFLVFGSFVFVSGDCFFLGVVLAIMPFTTLPFLTGAGAGLPLLGLLISLSFLPRAELSWKDSLLLFLGNGEVASELFLAGE